MAAGVGGPVPVWGGLSTVGTEMSLRQRRILNIVPVCPGCVAFGGGQSATIITSDVKQFS